MPKSQSEAKAQDMFKIVNEKNHLFNKTSFYEQGQLLPAKQKLKIKPVPVLLTP